MLALRGFAAWTGLAYPRNTLPVRMVANVMNRLVWRGPVHASVPSPDVIDRLTESGRSRSVVLEDDRTLSGSNARLASEKAGFPT